ncbi:MAG: hypothetical protein AMXMBFR12_09370 [Candidatus Babeliales bacterium]
MKNFLIIFLSFFVFISSYADQRQEQRIKQLQEELIHMSPLVQACASLLPHETPANQANYNRIIDDFNILLNELCRLQDKMHLNKQ